MELKDFTEKEQEQIEKGLSTAEFLIREAAKKLLLYRKEWIKHSILCQRACDNKTIERVAMRYLISMPLPNARETF